MVDDPGAAGIAKTTVAATLTPRAGTDLSADTEQTRALYRERAHLIAVLAAWDGHGKDEALARLRRLRALEVRQ